MNSIFRTAQLDDPSLPSLDTLCFGSFTLHRRQRLLLRNDVPVALGSRALDLLIALTEKPGELLEKAELIACAWPKVIVEECNLRAQIVALRRALREDGGVEYIVNVPGRGYRFIAGLSPGAENYPQESREAQRTRLPNSVTAPLGRERTLERLNEQIVDGALLSLVGPVGIGKSTIAVALANHVDTRMADGVCYLDLVYVDPQEGLIPVLAQVLGLPATPDADQVIDHLRTRHLLLVLDNCDPLLDAAALFVDRLLHWAPGCAVIATSREPLRTEGERLERLLPLSVPPREVESVEQALEYPSMQLLIERVRAHDAHYELQPEDLRAAVGVCRAMDGVPLDIEIAANRVTAFGMQQVAGLVKTDYRLEMKGHRTASPRHRCLRAALDHAYGFLGPDEQALLQFLSVFDGAFTLEAVRAIVGSEANLEQHLLPLIDSLVEKSMLIAEPRQHERNYRLLRSQRIYSRERLDGNGLTGRLQARQALYAMEVVKGAAAHLAQVAPELWRSVYGAESDTVRAAITWACSAEGDQPLGQALFLAVLGIQQPQERESSTPGVAPAQTVAPAQAG